MASRVASAGRALRAGDAWRVAALARRRADGAPHGRHVAAGAIQRRSRCTARAGAKTAPVPVTSLESPPDGVWTGLREWRAAPLNRRWVWGKRDALTPEEAEAERLKDSTRSTSSAAEDDGASTPPGPWVALALETAAADATPLPPTLAECADLILRTPDPATKAALTHRAYARFFARGVDDGHLSAATAATRVGVATPPDVPARPRRPELVPPKDVPSPKSCALGVSAAMIHNIAHIELNAVDLAWDTVARFSAFAADDDDSTNAGSEGSSRPPKPGPFRLPLSFFRDFAHVADDEARHLGWCLQRLAEMGVAYGDVPAHNVLWEGAESTSESLPARLAVVPCMQEARGLDAGPRLRAKLQGHGDNRSADVVDRISREELAHVAVGVAWFRQLCERVGADPGEAFRGHIKRHAPDALRGPFNHEARVAAGLEPNWYSVAPEHRMGHEFELEPAGGGEALGGGAPAALAERLGAVLALEGVRELPPSESDRRGRDDE